PASGGSAVPYLSLCARRARLPRRDGRLRSEEGRGARQRRSGHDRPRHLRRGRLLPSTHHISSSSEMGARRPFFVKEQGDLAATHEKERHLRREIAQRVETALPETEVLAVELTKPDGFTVYIDDVRGVDHALCERVTSLLVEYRRAWDISVSSPGSER